MYPVVSRADPEQQQKQNQLPEQKLYSEATSLSNDSATGGANAHGDKLNNLSPIVDKSPDVEHMKEQSQQNNPQATEVGRSIFIEHI